MAFVAPIPLLWLVREARPARGFILGVAFGVAYFGALLYWILLFGELAWGSLVLLSCVSTGLFGALAPAVWRRERPIRSCVGLAALWTVIEWVRGAWPLGGFTWGALGSTQTGDASLLKLASVAGMWGISFVVLLVAALLLLAADRAADRRRTGVLVAIALSVGLVLAPGLIVLPAANGPPVDVAAIQVNVLTARGPDATAEDIAVARLNAGLHERLAEDPPDLAVWGRERSIRAPHRIPRRRSWWCERSPRSALRRSPAP